MLTVLEVGRVDDDRVRELRACPDPELRRVLARPGAATWTEAHGREVIVEHVAAAGGGRKVARWSSVGGGTALRDLVQLHRPAAIVCGEVEVSAIARLASARLEPRAALIGVVQGERAFTWWEAQALASLDAVFVDGRLGAQGLWEQGVDRIYHVPRGVDLDVFSPARRDAALMGEGAVAIVIGADVDAPVLRRIHAALRRALPMDPALVILEPGASQPRDRLARFAAGFARVHLPACGDACERARWLAACDLAVILPHREAGSRAAEAMACGLPVVEPSEVDPDVIADAVVRLLRSGTAEGRAQSLVEHLRLADCLARERLCVREVIEHVRAGRRVPSGIHERMQPPRLTD